MVLSLHYVAAQLCRGPAFLTDDNVAYQFLTLSNCRTLPFQQASPYTRFMGSTAVKRDVCQPFESIALYADGSFSYEAGVGAWAFKVPQLNLEGEGSTGGKTVTRFEFLAVLEGLEAVAAADKSRSPIQVFSDCDSTVAAINSLTRCEPLKKPERYTDRADLLPRLQAVLAVHPVDVTRYAGGSLHHQDCHAKAHRRLRREIDCNPISLHRLALSRGRLRLSQLLGDRESILKRLAKLDEDVSVLQLQVASLELSLRLTDFDPGKQIAASEPVLEALPAELSLPSADSTSGCSGR
jgi:ribonuclease HI